MFDALGRILELREARGMSVYKLAKLTGIPQTTFVTWYSYNRYPGLDKIELMCDVFGITLAEFFSDSEQLEKGQITEELADLNSKYLVLTDTQKKAVNTVIDAFLHE
ncbi:helix-turn-helix domain-containing protein [Butyrivibrio sp. MB2005]|jgi:transcriptional regulator with XRE-family HTH domain|uniref:helix-turn-helix domain-containing protein n=1 Tax=Butyrivibrio sp. MB2005 TaxID=1280678 RepID=UPI000416ED7F|nr:helix-turn-helix transcriptional regulator [Butyrivibrio sp. MB2005]